MFGLIFFCGAFDYTTKIGEENMEFKFYSHMNWQTGIVWVYLSEFYRKSLLFL